LGTSPYSVSNACLLSHIPASVSSLFRLKPVFPLFCFFQTAHTERKAADSCRPLSTFSD